jgi:hypothetical protein
MCRFPSALPLPKKYTNFFAAGVVRLDVDLGRFAVAFFAIDVELRQTTNCSLNECR